MLGTLTLVRLAGMPRLAKGNRPAAETSTTYFYSKNGIVGWVSARLRHTEGLGTTPGA